MVEGLSDELKSVVLDDGKWVLRNHNTGRRLQVRLKCSAVSPGVALSRLGRIADCLLSRHPYEVS